MNRRVVFTAYNRPFYFTHVLDSWTQVRGVLDWRPTVFLEPSSAAQEMTRLAHNVGFRVHQHTSRQGVLHNPWVAFDTAFTRGAEFVVLAEDDILISDDVLEYMTWAATTLRDQHVLAVCAASFADHIEPDQQNLIVPTTQFCPLIWGTWVDRWTGTLRDTWDHDYSSGQATGTSSGWDWNLNLRVIPNGGWDLVQPLASRCDHIGRIMGTHTTEATYPGSRAATFLQHRPRGSYQLRVR